MNVDVGRRARQLVGAGIVLLWLVHPAAAQLQVPIQFDFLNPGARSLAMGGAFVGLADDATAALVNPAGLIDLTLKEVSVEGRYRRFNQPFLVGGRLSGQVTGQGVDTVAGPSFDTTTSSRTAPTFVSFVYPHKKFRLAIFRHELIHLDQAFSSSGAFQNHGFETRDTALAATRELAIDTYGASAAMELPRLWIGGGILVQRFSLSFQLDRFLHQSFYGVPDPTQSVFQFSQDGHDTGVGAVVGILVPISMAKIGVSYKRAPRFEFSSVASPFASPPQQSSGEFKVPDTLAIGGSARLGNAFVVTTEYTRVFHSQLRADYLNDLVNQGETQDRADRFTIDDANEFHVGAEYIMPIARRPGIRGGLWFDPDHSVHYTPTPANDLLDERIAASLSSGRDLWHYTFGAMVPLYSQVDLSGGVDHSARSTVVSISAIIHF